MHRSHRAGYPFIIFVAAVVVILVYSTPGLLKCFWRFYDSDFWYSVATVRWLNGLSVDLYEDPGYPQIQFLGWLYFVATKVGVLNELSYQDLLDDPAPLFLLRDYVISGWVLSAIMLALTAWIMFRFAKLIASSNAAGFVAASLVICSWSTVQFLWKIKSEPLSALCGVAALFFMFKALRTTSLRSFIVGIIISGVLLYIALLAKLNAYIALLFLPLVPLLELDTPLDNLSHKDLISLARKSLVLCLWLTPFVLLLMNVYLQDMTTFETFALSHSFAAFLLVYIFAIAFIRVWVKHGRMVSMSLISSAMLQASNCLLLFLIAFQIMTVLSFLHPSTNMYAVATVLCCFAGAIASIAATSRSSLVFRWAKKRRWSMQPAYMYLVCFIALVAAWYGTKGLVWLYPRLSYYVSAEQPGADISRSLFHMLNLGHAIQVYVVHDAKQVGIAVHMLQALSSVVTHVIRYRWAELIGVATVCWMIRKRYPKEALLAVFFVLVGIGFNLVSAVRGLVDFYIIYEDLYTILAVSICLSCGFRFVRTRYSGLNLRSHPVFMSILATVLILSSLNDRLGWMRDVHSGALPYRIVLTDLIHLYPTHDPTHCKALSDIPQVPEEFIYPRAGYW